MKTIYSVISLFFVLNIASAQVTQEWAARYNGIENSVEDARSIAVDESGNVYVTGSEAGSVPGVDYVTVKYNSSGIQQWAQKYNGPGNVYDYSHAIAVDGSGNVYVTGASVGNGTSSDYATIKYNSSGIQQWVQRYNGPGNSDDGAISISVDESGNVYVAGSSNSTETILKSDFVTIKYNSEGDSVWVQRFKGQGDFDSQAFSMTVDNSGNVYVTGSSGGNGTDNDYATIKYNSSGVQQWVQIFSGTGNSNDGAISVAVDGTGNVYLTGWSRENGVNFDYSTIKYNAAGILQWEQKYNGPANLDDFAKSVSVDASGNVYVTGSSKVTNSISNYATIKYNSDGSEQWVQRYSGPSNLNSLPTAFAVDHLGNVYVTGLSRVTGEGNDYATIKYNSDGDSVWVRTYNGTGNSSDEASSIAVDASGNVYVTGWSTGTGTVNAVDIATIKYSQTTGISQISTVIPDKFSLSQNYPNPFNPTTNFEFAISNSGFVSLKIYNMLGKEVATVVNSEMNPGTYKYEFDASNLASGVYLYKLTSGSPREAGSFTETKQMILVK